MDFCIHTTYIWQDQDMGRCRLWRRGYCLLSRCILSIAKATKIPNSALSLMDDDDVPSLTITPLWPFLTQEWIHCKEMCRRILANTSCDSYYTICDKYLVLLVFIIKKALWTLWFIFDRVEQYCFITRKTVYYIIEKLYNNV